MTLWQRADTSPAVQYPPPEKAKWTSRVQHALGLDRAIIFTVLGRLLQGMGSIITVLMIVRFLTPSQQGYYYTLWSLVALQSVFELGFSFVILQIAAHERAHLEFHPDGSITGSEIAHARLASMLQRAVYWYLFAAVLMSAFFLIGGSKFFELRLQDGSSGVWQMPLRITVLACALTFSIGPVLSFLEGCGQVTSIARMRFFQSIVGMLLSWIAMLTHHGLFSPAMVLLAQGAVASIMLYSRRKLLLPLLRYPVSDHAVSWRKEVWPFQWKIAVSWICDYFILQLFTPALFAFRGPVEAGKMGLSMNIVIQIGGIMLAWMTTKAAPFGILVASNNIQALDHLFFETFRKSLFLFAVLSACVMVGFGLMTIFVPSISRRVVPWPVFLLLLLTAISSHAVQSMALYLRAHKCEPFLYQSIAIAICTACSVLLTVRAFGIWGVSIAYFLVLGVAGVSSAAIIFRKKRLQWHGTGGLS